MTNANINTDSKVVNLHYTDRCNYLCRFCHCRFQKTPLGMDDWKKIIDNIASGIPVRRFNLAGGEPLAGEYIQKMIDYIEGKGIECSIITNGSLLTPDFIRSNQGKLQMIGISIDGLDDEDNRRIGRIDRHGNTLSNERLLELARAIHAAGMRLKINTVVNAVNCQKDFSPLIQCLMPDRWKLLRMLHYENANDNGRNLMVTDEEFQTFAKRHQHLHPVVEDTADMVNSYIVVNPQGRILTNSAVRFQATESLVNHPFRDEFIKVSFDENAYQKRYKSAS